MNRDSRDERPRRGGKTLSWLAIGTVALFASLFIGLIHFGDPLGAARETVNVSGEEDLAAADVKLIKVPFNNAKLKIESTLGSKVAWSCHTVGAEAIKGQVVAGVFNLNLEALAAAKCFISIPSGMASEFRGVNGRMDVKTPQNAMRISLVNGKVDISLDPHRAYDFDVKVKNGLQDFFPRSGAKDAVKVQVDVVNGLVKKE